MRKSEPPGDTRLEIGHILFVDIVGYSKLLTNEQRERLKELNGIVRETRAFHSAQSAGKLLRLPTGDGMVLAFFDSPDAPVRCAIAISHALAGRTDLPLRMGIHSGPVERISDVDDRANLAGAGVNMAQRVMYVGDAGHILLSARAAEDLAQFSEWKDKLHPLGEVEVKHGLRVGIVSLWDREIGNAHAPEKMRLAELRARKAKQRRLLTVGSIVAACGIAAAISVWISSHSSQIPNDKSIAVLPFENLSADKENAFLVSGLQDEILTQLAKIGSLKVISRTSTQHYESKPKSVAKIAAELGVASILEGRVEKVGDSIRVNIQLIDAATDGHLWAESYDRKLIDLLKVQSDIAQEVASALRTKLTPDEKARIEQEATKNPEAYGLYLKGTEVLRRPAVAAERMEEGQHYFEQAIALDPNFALAHARLALIHSRIAVFFDPSPLHMEKGRSEAEEALRLQPQLSEGHVALGFYYGRLTRDYDAALKHYEIARTGAPNDAYILYGIANVEMKRGQFRAAIANWEQATSLDPRNWVMFDNIGGAYNAVGMWAAAERAKRRAAELATGTPIEKFNVEESWGWAYYELTGSLEKLDDSIAHYQSTDDSTGLVALETFYVAMVKRDYDRAQRAIEQSPATIFETFTGPRSTKKFLLGIVALARGERDKARSHFEAELPFARSELAESPDSAPRRAQLGLICAYLGRKEEAIAEGEHAVEMLPISKDAVDGPGIATALAEIYGRVGEEEKAITLLEKLVTVPNGPTQTFLKDWNWDPLRNNSRFQKLVNGPRPKIEYQ